MKFLVATLFASIALSQSLECTLCEKAAGILKNDTDTISNYLDKICMNLNGTAHELECKLAVKTLMNLINTESAEQLCEKVKLCKETEVSEMDMLFNLATMTLSYPLIMPELTQYKEETKPQVDMCAICKEAVGVVQSHTQDLLKYLDGLCAKLNNTIEKAACDEAVQVAVNVLNSQTAEQVCTEIKLCSSTEKRSVKSYGETCGSCQKMFKVMRNNPSLVSDVDCFSLNGVTNWHTCILMKMKAEYALNSYAPDEACINMGACAEGYISGVW